MNLNTVIACALCSVLGAATVKFLDHKSEDTVIAKRVVVTDDAGTTQVLIDGTGVQVMGENKDSYTRIKAADAAQMNFVHGGNTVVSIGQSLRGTDGLTLYRNGKVTGAFTSNDTRTVMGILEPFTDAQAAGGIEDLMKENHNYALLSSYSGSIGLTVRLGDKQKEFSLPEGSQK